MKLGNLVVEISADSAKFVAGVADTEIRLDNLNKRARSAVNTFGKYSAAAAVAGTAVTAALYTKAAQAIDAQAKLAQRLDTTSLSVANLERAGGLAGVSLEKITQGSSDLTRRLSQAAKNGGPVKDALDSIGLSAKELQMIPLDERIEQINKALIENADASQKAALAGQLFGEEGSLFMTQISPEVLAQARKEVELFGLALTDVDAAKVEQANDAFSTFGMAADGIVQQLTVQMAPIVKAISDEFISAADEAGGFGNIAIDAFDKVVSAAAFVADAADGVKRTFQLTADGIIIAINSAMATVARIVADTLDTISVIPGVDFSETVTSLNEFAATSENVVDEAWNNIDETLNKPFAGDSLRQFVEDARIAGEEAARATVEARSAMTPTDGGVAAVDPETQRLREQLATRIQAIQDANATEFELLTNKHATELEEIIAAKEQQLLTEQEYNELFKETKARHEEEITDLEKQQSDMRKRMADEEARYKQQAMSQALSNLTTLMNSENRKMFEIGKAAALAQAVVDGYAAVVGAYKVGASIGGPALGAAYGISAALATAQQINAIRSQSFGGGGGGTTGSATQTVNAETTPVQSQQASQTMFVSGIEEGELFTGGRVRSLVGELLEYQRNGGQVILA